MAKPNPFRVVAFIAALAATPFVLTAWIGAPIPREWPTAEQWEDLLDGLDVTHLHAAFRIFLWACWLAVAIGTVWELAAYLTTRPADRRRKRSPLRILGGVVLGTTATAAITNPVAATATVAVAEYPDTSDQGASTAEHDKTKTDSHPAPHLSTSSSDHEDDPYVVQHDDNLSVIAEDTLGSQSDWPELFQHNKGKTQPDGEALTDPDLIRPDWILDVPDIDAEDNDSEKPTEPGPQPDPENDDTSPPPANGNDNVPKHRAEPRFPDNSTIAEDDDERVNGVVLAIGTAVSIGFVAAMWAAVRTARRRIARYRNETGHDPKINLALPRSLAEVESPTNNLQDNNTAPALGVGTDGSPFRLADAVRGGLGFTGPGAPSAARAAIAAALADSDQDAASSGIDIIITGDVLDQLTNTLNTPLGIRRLLTLDNAHDVERRISQDIVAKARDAEESDASSHGANSNSGQVIAILDAEAHDPDTLSTLLAQGRALKVGAIILGNWNARTIHIEPDGTTDTESPSRCHTMDPAFFTHTLSTLDAIATTTDEPFTTPADEPRTLDPEPNNREARQGALNPSGAEPRPTHPVRHVVLPSWPSANTGSNRRQHATLPRPASTANPSATRPLQALPHLDDVPSRHPTDATTDQAAAQQPAIVRLTVLGDVQAHVDDQPIHFTRAKGRELLALLATEPNGLPADTVSEFIVGETQVSKARSHLASIVTSTRGDLRKATGAAKSIMFINYSKERYALDKDLISSDLNDFTARLASARTANNPAEEVTHLAKVIDTYHGDYASDITDDTWPEPIRTALRNDAHRACLDIAGHHAKTNDTGSAIRYLKKAVALSPYDEVTYQYLIKTLLRAERRDQAKTIYLRLQSNLAKLNKKPCAETRQLFTLDVD